MENILKNLNPRQKEAVTTTVGPVLILSGPGSGKTRVITHRIAYLIQKGVKPQNILAVTFTNKAAGEMRSRVAKLLTADSHRNSASISVLPKAQYRRGSAAMPFMGTFHAFCLRILRKEIAQLGYKNNFIVYDEQDQLSLVKKAMKELQIDKEQFKPSIISSVISSLKGELIDYENYLQKPQNYFEKTTAKIYQAYQIELKKANGVDFDDLIMLTVGLFQKFPEILKKYQEKFKYILVDEYQDTDTSQYILIHLLAKKYKNICVVGDDAQCLLPNTKINTEKNDLKISQIQKETRIKSASGHGEMCDAVIQKKYERYYNGPLIKITTKTGKTISLTPNHAIFLRLPLNPKIYFVYLMFRRDKGYRVGSTKGSRTPKLNQKEIGLKARCNQEKADKMWILKICKSKSEATYWENYYSFKYGIPTTVFFNRNREMVLTQTQINRIFKQIDTIERANRLMKDLLINKEVAHFIPQGTTPKNPLFKKLRVRLTMFSSDKKSLQSPWDYHRVSVYTGNIKFKQEIKKLGFSARKGKRKNDWRLEISSLDYKKIEQIAHKIQSINDEIEIQKTAILIKHKNVKQRKFSLQPASHAHPSMLIPIKSNSKILEDEIIKVEKKQYKGYVYDLNVQNVHNYIANGIVVHNSIYAFRGADFRNILNFEKDYPGAKIVILAQNYRSTQNILNTAKHIINKNIYQKEKNLWTKNPKGKPIIITEAINEIAEREFIIEELKSLQQKSGLNLKDFAVLYRTNAQSRALEEGFIRHKIPYKIVGTVKFYQRKEIKDILAYLKLVLYPDDLVSLQRIINIPPRGIGRVTIEKILKDWPNPRYQNFGVGVKKFNELINKARKIAKNKSLTELLNFLLEETKYKDYLQKTYNEKSYLENIPEYERRWQNVQELFSVVKQYNDLKEFLDNCALLSEEDEMPARERGGETKKDLVNLMTLHAAKGLEFSAAFISGCEEGLFPHARSMLNPLEMEEERRLCYVGITRAKEYLYLTFAQRRTLYGLTQANPPSRFLADIPKKLIEYRIEEESDGESIINF